ncbi:MAG TPA: L-2-amino-thiazoline-4-carboxylic acid hydrolase, partial [Candidatus Entotheonella sp.]
LGLSPAHLILPPYGRTAMHNRTSQAEKMFRQKFERFGKLVGEMGDQDAWEKMLEGYPERQRKSMGTLIENASLAEGFAKAIPLFKQMGMTMEVIDISTPHVDAVLEIQRTCPVLRLCQTYGFAKPCRIICEMDVEATRRAFPGLQGEILSRQADGACVCVFKYERARQA